ncbi:MAG TPA: uracil-DNA glycosylase [Pseudolabrys sp.]|nr:uracil-DNA glycosylase [Pseudolabrys sp.]
MARARSEAPAHAPRRCASDPGRDCPRCPRLVAFRNEWRGKEPGWFNAPVPSFGPVDARLLIVGLAPGLQGANRTGRPFTGDYAGVLLYETLGDFDFAKGTFGARIDDGLTLTDCRITNAVRCVPPENKPTPAEITACRDFLIPAITEMKNLRAIVALGAIAHQSVLSAFAAKKSAMPFKHGGKYMLSMANANAIAFFSSYHCSRYNTNTGVLTPKMFRDVFKAVRGFLDGA